MVVSRVGGRKSGKASENDKDLVKEKKSLNQTKMSPGKKLVRRTYSIFFTALRSP